MIWIYAYIAVGFFMAIAMFIGLDRDGKLKGVNPISGVIGFAVLVILWPSAVIYRYL